MINILLFSLAWIIGLVSGAFLLIQSCIIVFFGIPFTLKMQKEKMIKKKGPVPGYIFSVILLLGLLALVTWLMLKFMPNSIIGYWVGLGFAFLLGIGKCGMNDENMKDYFESNERFINEDALNTDYTTIYKK